MTTNRNQNPIPLGLTLVELVIALTVVSALAGIAVGALSGTTGAARTNSAQRNARTLCSLYESATTAGVRFTSDSKEGILDELIEGKTGTDPGASQFRMAPLDEEAKTAALAYCAFDETLRTLGYREGVKEGEAPSPVVPNQNWSNWRPALSERLDGEDLANALGYFASHYPDYQFKADPDSNAPGLSNVLYRYPLR